MSRTQAIIGMANARGTPPWNIYLWIFEYIDKNHKFQKPEKYNFRRHHVKNSSTCFDHTIHRYNYWLHSSAQKWQEGVSFCQTILFCKISVLLHYFFLEIDIFKNSMRNSIFSPFPCFPTQNYCFVLIAPEWQDLCPKDYVRVNSHDSKN